MERILPTFLYSLSQLVQLSFLSAMGFQFYNNPQYGVTKQDYSCVIVSVNIFRTILLTEHIVLINVAEYNELYHQFRCGT